MTEPASILICAVAAYYITLRVCQMLEHLSDNNVRVQRLVAEQEPTP